MIKISIKGARGAARIRTDDFKSFRSKLKSQPMPIEFAKREVQFSAKSAHQNFNEQIHDALPPEWVDVYEKINEDFEKLEEKMTKLNEVQHEKKKKVFSEHSRRNNKIEALLDENSKLIKNIEAHIKNFTKEESNEDDSKIRKNIQKKLASRLKDTMSQYRNIEGNYLSTVQKSPEGTDSSGLFEVEKQEEMKVDKIKNDEIQKLADNFTQLAEIFKELNLLIVDQGTILDRIDYSLSQGKDNTAKANTELIKAENHQKCTRATSCLLILVVLIVLLLMILIFKNT